MQAGGRARQIQLLTGLVHQQQSGDLTNACFHRRQPNQLTIELSENILFDSGRADLRDEGEVALSEIVQVLNSIPNRQFQVAGHTDNIPMRSSRFQSNWELSTARAVNVARFMIDQGLNAERISAAGYAETQPVASNSTPEGRAQNRRIEIVLVPNLDELPDLSSLSEEGGAS